MLNFLGNQNVGSGGPWGLLDPHLIKLQEDEYFYKMTFIETYSNTTRI